MEPFTIIEIYPDGTTKPQVEPETEILLIQDGDVSVGKITYDGDGVGDLYIDSPVNEAALNKEALQLVKDNFPQYLKTEKSIVLICPEAIADKMIW